jgi:cobalt-zinc-cadmium efflux system protein
MADVFTHAAACPASTDRGASCTCERPRYLKVLAIGVTFGILEYAAGFIAGSSALKGDAAHLITDAANDAVALTIASLVARYHAQAEVFRRWGGYVQAALLVLASLLITFHAYERMIGDHPIDARLMVGVGAVAFWVNWWRYKILHPQSGLWKTLMTIGRSLSSGKKELTTYIAELFHVITDMGLSVIVVAGGIVVFFTGDHRYDAAASAFMAVLVLIGAVMVSAFAGRNHHHHH